MADDSQKNGLVKVASTSVVRYSNALVRRGVEDAASISPELGRLLGKRKRVLLEAAKGKTTHLLMDILGVGGFDVVDVWSSTALEQVFKELSEHPYDAVMLTIGGIETEKMLGHVSQIKSKYPDVKVVILAGDRNEDFIKQLYSMGANIVFSWQLYRMNDDQLGITEYRMKDGQVVGGLWYVAEFVEAIQELFPGHKHLSYPEGWEKIHEIERDTLK